MAFKMFENAKDKLTGRKPGGDTRAHEDGSGFSPRAQQGEGSAAQSRTVHAEARSRAARSAAHAGDDATRELEGRLARSFPRGASPGRTIPPHPGSSISFQDESPYRASGGQGGQPGGKKGRKRKPNWITRQVNRWANRLVGAVAEGSFSEQEEQYASHRTTRDYIWNTVGLASWGVVFPILSIVVTQLVGTEQAGMFAMAFTVALLLMFVANYGVRTYQVSDLDEEHSFSDYQINRVLTCAIMMAVGFAYGAFRGYGAEMMTICAGVYVYKMVDGWADVYEGRLQQMDKLYLAGISQTFRSVTVLVIFSLTLLITRNLMVSCIVMGVVAVLTLFVLTIPLALLETPKSRKLSVASVVSLLKQCFPLFVALFMYNLIENMPKFMMEGMLPYDNQLYYNAMWFPANALVIFVQVIYKPLLVRMAGIWADMRTRKRFDILVIAMLAVIVAITCGVCAVMWAVGAPVLGFLYGVDFEPYRGLIVVMVVAGGVSAAIDFIYQAVTLLRKQGSVTKLYIVTFGFSLFIPTLLVGFTGLPGAVLSYLIIMSFLLVLLVWEYLRIRIALANEPVEDAPAPRERVYENEAAVRMPARRDGWSAQDASAGRQVSRHARPVQGAQRGIQPNGPSSASRQAQSQVPSRGSHAGSSRVRMTQLPAASSGSRGGHARPADAANVGQAGQALPRNVRGQAAQGQAQGRQPLAGQPQRCQSAGRHAVPAPVQHFDDYAGVEVDEMTPREKARAAHAERLRREEAAAKRAERHARRAAMSEAAHEAGKHASGASGDSAQSGAAQRNPKNRGAHGRNE